LVAPGGREKKELKFIKNPGLNPKAAP